MPRIAVNAVYTGFWNVAQTIPQRASNDEGPSKSSIRLKSCSFTAESALNEYCVFHSSECSACQKSSFPPSYTLSHAYASLNKIRNTKKRRQLPVGTTESILDGDLGYPSIGWTDSENEDHASPDSVGSNADPSDSRLEILDNFATTENERLTLLECFQGGNTAEYGGRGILNQQDLPSFKRPRTDSAIQRDQDEHQLFEEWIHSSFDELFSVAHALGE